MSTVDDVRSSTILALADGRIRCAFAAHTFCSIAVGSSASSASRACRAVAVHHIRCFTRSALNSEARVGGTFTLHTQRAVCRWGAAGNTLFTRRLRRIGHLPAFATLARSTSRAEAAYVALNAVCLRGAATCLRRYTARLAGRAAVVGGAPSGRAEPSDTSTARGRPLLHAVSATGAVAVAVVPVRARCCTAFICVRTTATAA